MTGINKIDSKFQNHSSNIHKCECKERVGTPKILSLVIEREHIPQGLNHKKS